MGATARKALSSTSNGLSASASSATHGPKRNNKSSARAEARASENVGQSHGAAATRASCLAHFVAGGGEVSVIIINSLQAVSEGRDA
jgi:hypothetical protein